MVIIVGLGNPEEKYKNTRHNLGFRVVNEFAKENNFPKFRLARKFNALISKKDDVLLVKPQTFMNDSGKAVRKVLKFTETRVSVKNRDPGLCLNLYVLHDDIDLPLAKIKIVKNRGSAGHKGVQSIIKELSSKDFTRLRVGIQPKQGKPQNVEKFVLQKFTKEEEMIIKEVIKKAASELSSLK